MVKFGEVEGGEIRSDNEFIRTFTGRKFWPLDPRPEEVSIVDIGHALSNQGRWTGHTRSFYSVAEHCTWVALKVAEATKSKALALHALLHDASEAYIADIARPVKKHPEFAFYKKAEYRLEVAIGKRFGFPAEMSPFIKEADNRMLATERRDLMPVAEKFLAAAEMESPYEDIDLTKTMTPEEAESEFLAMYLMLGGKPDEHK